jgi:sortase A
MRQLGFSMQRLSAIGAMLTITGVVLLLAYACAEIHRTISSRLAIREVDQQRAEAAPEGQKRVAELPANGPIDFSLWSKGRVRAYSESLRLRKGSPIAVLRFERWNLRVPVFEGTDAWTLNRGVGWIAGTARPGEAGNIGLAGHRDGFFRPLKDVTLGTSVELYTGEGTATYMVDEIEIVTPNDVRVLQPRSGPSLTLVTCYPFYFVGEAPRRFIVHAALKPPSRSGG